MIDIAPRHDCQNNPESQTLVAFRVHRKRVDASEGKGRQPSDAPSLGLRYVGAEGDAWQPVGIAHERRTPAFPRIPDCDGLRHICAEDADYAVAFAGRVARRAARRAIRRNRFAEETGLAAVYCSIMPLALLHESREAPIHFPLYYIFVYQFSSRKEPIMSELPEEQPDAQSHDESDIKAAKAFLSPQELSEKKETTKTAIDNLDLDVAKEEPDIDNIPSAITVVKISVVPLVVGFALRTISKFPGGPESATFWLATVGILVSIGAPVVAAYSGWKCKKYLAMIQLKIDALDIWEKYHEVKDDGKEAVRDLRTAYLLKKSYINTITWGLSGVTIVAALISVLVANV